MRVETGMLLLWLCSGAEAATFSYLFDQPTDAPTYPNTVFSSFTRVGLTETTQAGAFASGGWNDTLTLNKTEFVQFTLTPNAGYFLDMSALSFDAWNKNGSVGPTLGMAEIFLGTGPSLTSLETYSFNISPTRTTVNFDLGDFSGADNQGITVRFYAWGSRNKNQGELFFDNVTLTGNINPVPEPVTMALVLFGVGFCGTAGFRKLRGHMKCKRNAWR